MTSFSPIDKSVYPHPLVQLRALQPWPEYLLVSSVGKHCLMLTAEAWRGPILDICSSGNNAQTLFLRIFRLHLQGRERTNISSQIILRQDYVKEVFITPSMFGCSQLIGKKSVCLGTATLRFIISGQVWVFINVHLVFLATYLYPGIFFLGVLALGSAVEPFLFL